MLKAATFSTKDTQRPQNGMPMFHALQGGQKDGSAEFRRAFRKVLAVFTQHLPDLCTVERAKDHLTQDMFKAHMRLLGADGTGRPACPDGQMACR